MTQKAGAILPQFEIFCFEVSDPNFRIPARVPYQVVSVAPLHARLPLPAKDRMELPGEKVRQAIDANGKGNGLQNVLSFCFEPAWRVGVYFEPDLEVLRGMCRSRSSSWTASITINCLYVFVFRNADSIAFACVFQWFSNLLVDRKFLIEFKKVIYFS